jgi:glutamate decarboxylase
MYWYLGPAEIGKRRRDDMALSRQHARVHRPPPKQVRDPEAWTEAPHHRLLAFGREGYRRTMRTAQDVAVHLSSGIPELGPYRLISEGRELPVFAFTLAPEVRNYDVFDVSDRLRQHGWLVPAYTFPENRQDLSVLRIVVRAGMNHEMAYLLLDHLEEETKFLESLDAPLPGVKHQAFAH